MAHTASMRTEKSRPQQAEVTRTLLLASAPFLLACIATVVLMWSTKDATSLQLAPGESVLAPAVLAAIALGALVAAVHFRLTVHKGLGALGLLLIAVSSLMAAAPLTWGAMRAINVLSVGPETRTRMHLVGFRTVPQKHGRTPHRYAVVAPQSLPSAVPAGTLFITTQQHETWTRAKPDHLTVTSAKGLLGARAIVRIDTPTD